MPGDAAPTTVTPTAPNGAANGVAKPVEAKPKDQAAKPVEAAKPAEAKPATEKASDKSAAEKPKDTVAEAWAKIGAAEKRLATERATEREALKKEREALEAMRKEVESGRTSVETLRARVAKGELDEIAHELGFDYGAWTKKKLGGGAKKPAGAAAAVDPSDVARLVEERVAKALEERETKRSKADDEAREAHWKSTMSAFVELAQSKGEADAPRYELLADEIAERGVDFIEKTLREIAVQAPHLTLEQAAEKYEAWLLDRARAMMSKSKVKALLAPPPPTTKTETTERPREQSGQASGDGPRTLTNSLAAERAPGLDASRSGLSRTAQIRAERQKERERLDRAAARMNEE